MVYILEIVSRRIYIKLLKSALEVKKGLKIEKQRGFIFSIIKNFQTDLHELFQSKKYKMMMTSHKMHRNATMLVVFQHRYLKE